MKNDSGINVAQYSYWPTYYRWKEYIHMFTPVHGKPVTQKLHNSEQSMHNFAQATPNACLLIDILKTMEQQFQRRGFLPDPKKQHFHPLWFIAVNECNHYLWRHGYSLSQKNQFEFWIDIKALAKKRRQQLDLLKEGFSFSNPTWGLEVPSEENIQLEQTYLQKFLLVTGKIEKHVQALSQAGLLLEQELTSEGIARELVVIPS